MPEKIYSFNGKDITMNICIQIRDVVKLLQEHFHIAFEEAVLLFYKSVFRKPMDLPSICTILCQMQLM